MDVPPRKKRHAMAFPRGESRETQARSAVPAPAPRFRLPTIAALASLLIVASPRVAHAIVAAPNDAGAASADAAAEEDAADDDAGDAADDAADAASCPPNPDQYPVAGAMPPTRVHGGGCGCLGADRSESASASLSGVGLAVAVALSRRRR